MTRIDSAEASTGSETPAAGPPAGVEGGALRVGAGILASRLVGFVRDAVFAFFFGAGAHADAWNAALKGPNALQNLLGEGTLSASFIPVYSRLLAQGRPRDAGRFAGAILGLLLGTVALAVGLGEVFAETIVGLLVPGFSTAAGLDAAAGVDRFALTVTAFRILLPMTGVLVLHAWALGVLNSHRRFFLAYFAPVVWNTSMITALLWAGWQYVPSGASSLGGEELERILFALCGGALVGGILQFVIQLPLVFRLLKGFRLFASPRVEGVGQALRALGPVIAGRGAAQLGGYLDIFMASFLAAGALSALGFAQRLYLLPIGLFAVSVAAAALPDLSRTVDERAMEARIRLDSARISFLMVPAVVGYLVLGGAVISLLYERGQFGAEDRWLVYLVLAGYSLGLLATGLSRLLQNTFFALGDTATPARVGIARVALAAATAWPLMRFLDRYSVSSALDLLPFGRSADGLLSGGLNGKHLALGAVGLALASALGAWFELWRLTLALRRRLPAGRLPFRRLSRFIGLALLAVIPSASLAYVVGTSGAAGSKFTGIAALALFAGLYLGLAWWLRIPELGAWVGRFGGRTKAS